MKIRRFSFYGIWPAGGLLIAGIFGKLTNNDPQMAGLFICIGIVYIAVWFVFGLFKGSK
jgi:hypothetical protein